MVPAEKMKVEASYDSIYSALEKRARAVRFSSDFVAFVRHVFYLILHIQYLLLFLEFQNFL